MENRTIVTALKAGAAQLAGFGNHREGAHKNMLQVRARVKTSHSLCCFSVNEFRANCRKDQQGEELVAFLCFGIADSSWWSRPAALSYSKYFTTALQHFSLTWPGLYCGTAMAAHYSLALPVAKV